MFLAWLQKLQADKTRHLNQVNASIYGMNILFRTRGVADSSDIGLGGN